MEPQYPPSRYPTPDPLAHARPHVSTPATKMRHRATSWKNVFVAVLIVGLLGSALIAVAAGTSTDIYGTKSYDAETIWLSFGIAGLSVVLFALPFLAFSQIISGQADLYES